MAPKTSKKAQEYAKLRSRAGGPGSIIGPRQIVHAQALPAPPVATTLQGRGSRVYFQKNGLLSMKTPKELAPISLLNADKTHGSPLLRLPAEIRTQIFKFALTAPDATIALDDEHHAVSQDGTSEEFVCTDRQTSQSLGLALPRVCRQIYSEAATMVYAENTFFCSEDTNLESWAQARLDAQKRMPYNLWQSAVIPLGKLRV